MYNTIKELIVVNFPAVREMAAGLVPGALGAAVSVAIQGAMTWTQRVIQISVGVIVSYHAGQLAGALFDLSPVVQNSVGFVIGLGAFESVKNWKVGMAEVARNGPKDLWDLVLDRITTWTGGKKG